MMTKERELEIEQEMLEGCWKLLSKSRELDLTGAAKEIRGDD